MTSAKNIITARQLATAAAVLYSAPAQTSCVLKKLTFSNTTGAAVTVTVYLVAPGGTVGDANTLHKARSVDPLDVYECVEAVNHVLSPGASVQALASVGLAITVIGSGIETN